MRTGCRPRRRPLAAASCLFALVACGDDDAADTPASLSAPTTTQATTTVDTSDSMIGEWATAPSLLHPRAAHGVVATDDAIYVLAGIGEGRRPVMDVERFDGTAWSDIATLPGKGLNAPSAATVDGKIYVIGGFSGTSNKPTAEVHVYDIATSTWSMAAPLPKASGGHAAVVLDGRIHVVGGGTAQSTIADHVVYDPTTDTWTTAAPLSRPKGSPAVTVLDGHIWAVGGRSGYDDFGDVEVYDPATDQWAAGPEIDARGNAGAVAACGTILVAGGQQQNGSSVLDDVFVLDGDTWRADTPLPVARAFARTVLFGDAVYVVGGSDKYGQTHATPGSGTVEFSTPRC